MKIDVLTLFPDMIKGFLDKGLLTVNIIDFRTYSKLSNHQVDDTPYGGGAGMVLRCEPIFECLDDIRTPDSFVILTTPDGIKYNQNIAKDLSLNKKHIIIICGHYEGFDERIRSLCDMEISIGDYILTGGELASCVIIDSITRLIDGAINKESLESESFTDSLLDYPTYTKPRVYRGLEVPDILLSGNHQKIAEWRYQQRLEKTKERRPDLLKQRGE